MMCPTHNQHLAECDYGKEVMERYRVWLAVDRQPRSMTAEIGVWLTYDFAYVTDARSPAQAASCASRGLSTH